MLNFNTSRTEKRVFKLEDEPPQAKRQGQSSKAPELGVDIVDPWASATIDPNKLCQMFLPFKCDDGSAISDMDLYRSNTPNDTPELSRCGTSRHSWSEHSERDSNPDCLDSFKSDSLVDVKCLIDDGSAIPDMDLYRSITPNDTPELSRCGTSRHSWSEHSERDSNPDCLDSFKSDFLVDVKCLIDDEAQVFHEMGPVLRGISPYSLDNPSRLQIPLIQKPNPRITETPNIPEGLATRSTSSQKLESDPHFVSDAKRNNPITNDEFLGRSMVAREEDVDVESSYEGYHEFLNLDLFAFRDINVESSYEGYHEFNLNLDPFACRDIGVESSHEGHHEPNPNPDPFTFRDIGVESSYEGYHEFNLNLDPFAFRDINVESSYEGYDEIRPNESASRRIPRSWPHTESQSPPALESLPTSIDSESPMVSEILSSASSWGDCSTGFETDSTWSEDGSVWGEDGTPQIYDHLGLFGITATEKFAPHRKDSDLSVQQLLTPLKKKLVDGIMREFWVIFNQEWTANIQRHSGGSPQSMSSSISQCNNTSGSSSSSRGQKREREDEEDKNPEDNNGRDPKRPKVDFSPLKGSDERMKFACPYRKHDPRKYCHQIRRWRSCALTPLDTIARVKGHLYRYHRIFQCPRCKVLHESPEDLEKHTLAVKACELIHEQQAEGITGNIEKKLRSRKKTYRGQTETERWQEIYRILFPEEGVPSPYYEAVQDDIVQSPDSKELTSYEEYSRRELPRFFQSALEAAIVDEAQPIEERLRSRLVEMIQDCQERVFSTYKARRSTDTPPAAVANVSLGSLESPVSIDQQTEKAREEDITDIIQTLYERVPSQDSHQVHPEMVVADATSKNSGENAVSDSGYVSEPPVSNSDFFTNEDIAASEAVTENSSQHQQPPNTLQSVQETETETEVTVYQTSSLQEATIQQSTTYDTLELRNSESNIDESYPYSTGSEGYDMETGKWMDAWMCLNREETEHVGGF